MTVTPSTVLQALAAPAVDRAAHLLALREDQWFDRKSCRVDPRDLANTLIGMANAEGGIVAVGLWSGQVEGVDGAGGKLSSWQQATFDFAVPHIPVASKLIGCVRGDGTPDQLLVFDVQASDRVHANARDEVYLRVGDETRRLTYDQRRQLEFDKGQSTYEATEVGATLRELDDGLLAAYAGRLSHADPMRLLAARGLTTAAGGPTVAATLLFAEHPQRWLPESSVRVLRYRGTERGTGSRQQLVEDLRIDGPIPSQVEQATGAIERASPSRRALTASGRFELVPLIPRDAWLEALVNAVVHRAYNYAGDHIRVEIFDDRIEVASPGRFPGITDLSDPLHITRFARNPRIARVMADFDLGQELGEGVRRMFEEMRLAGLGDPAYEQTAGNVRVTLRSTPVDRALEAALPEGARGLVRAISDSGRLSTGEIVALSGLSRPKVLRTLGALRDAGVLDWVGHSPKDPRAYWQVRRE